MIRIFFPDLCRERITMSLANDERQPLFDRTIRGTYPPGSTAKLLTAGSRAGGRSHYAETSLCFVSRRLSIRQSLFQVLAERWSW